MAINRYRRLFVSAVGAFILSFGAPVWAQGFPGGHRDALGPLYEAAPRPIPSPKAHPRARMDAVHHWNGIAVDASGLDHTPLAPDEARIFGEQYGPTRASRAMAIVHIAIFEAVNAIRGHYRSYAGISPVPNDASIEAAIAQAAHDTLAALFPSQASSFDALLAEELDLISNGHVKQNGIEVGQRTAAAILALRANDGSEHPEPQVGIDFTTSDEPGKWRQDPVSENPLALGARWGEVKPFVMESADQFRVPLPPSLVSAEYIAAFDEAKRFGGDGIVTPTERTGEQTEIGIYWAYPSRHAGFGRALFETLRKFFGRDNIPFTFVSDEFTGVTRDHDGHFRPLTPRSFASLSEAEEQNGQSRIYLGIHWAFVKTDGISQGRNVADYVFDHAFTPLHPSPRRPR